MKASCQCGALNATIAENTQPFTVLCHCTDCQRRSGSPFGVIGYFPKDAVTIDGEFHSFGRDTYSGNRLTNQFCPSCGSTICVLLSKNEEIVGVPVGAFSKAYFPMPVQAVWEQDRHAWIDLPAGIERFERGTDAT